MIPDSIWAPSCLPLGPKSSDFRWEGSTKSTFSLSSVLSSSELDFEWILAFLEPPPKPQNRRCEVSKRLRARFLNPKTPSRPYCSVNDSPQDVFKTLFRGPKPASWSHFQAFVQGNHFGMSTSLRPLSRHHLEARWRKLRSIRIKKHICFSRFSLCHVLRVCTSS